MKSVLMSLLVMTVACAMTSKGEARSALAAELVGTNVDLRLKFAGVDRTYVLHVPSGYNPSTKYPLMVAFHPHNGTGAGMERITGFDALADTQGFLVAYPDSNPNYKDGRSWQTVGENGDPEFALEMIKAIQSSYSVDPAKIFISGFSMGGGMVQALACRQGRLFAGAAVVSQNLNPRSRDNCHPDSPIKIIFFHGTADPLSLYEGGANNKGGGVTLSSQVTAEFWARANHCGSTPTVTQFADTTVDGSNAPVATTDSKQVWTGGQAGAFAVFYTIGGGGHNWPGGKNGKASGPSSQGVHATEVIWQSLNGSGG